MTSVLTRAAIANSSAPDMIAWRPRLGAADERTTTVRSPIAFRLSIVPFRIEWRELARKSPECPSTELRVPAKIAQEQLGHASVSTTLGIYTHVVDASHRSAVEAVEERLFVVTVSNCLESAGPFETSVPASDSVN